MLEQHKRRRRKESLGVGRKLIVGGWRMEDGLEVEVWRVQEKCQHLAEFWTPRPLRKRLRRPEK